MKLIKVKTDFILWLIALFGGIIWQRLGIEMLFTLSAILGLCNSAYAATIKVKKIHKSESLN